MHARFSFCRHETPLGPLMLAGDGRALARIWFAGRHPDARARGWREEPALFDEARRQLDAYFAGRLRAFDLPLRLEGTAFQRQVWAALREIPHGEVITYGELARRVGKPRAARAVGAANGANPIPIIIPCHRVVAAGGRIGGFTGGLALKRRLLALEGVILP